MKGYNVSTTAQKGRYHDYEDARYVNPERGVFVITDGMTGRHGAYASNTVAAYVGKELTALMGKEKEIRSDSEFLDEIKDIVELANQRLLIISRREGKTPTPGTTLDATVLRGDRAYYAHVGDSSIYMIGKNGEFERVTNPHARSERLGDSPAPDADTLKVANDYRVTHGMGYPELKRDDIGSGILREPKKIFLTTDGLTDICTEAEIKALLTTHSGEPLLKAALNYHAEPKGIYETYLRAAPQIFEQFLTDETVLQELGVKPGEIYDPQTLHALFLDRVSSNEPLRTMIMNNIKSRLKLEEQDDISMILIEQKQGASRFLPKFR